MRSCNAGILLFFTIIAFIVGLLITIFKVYKIFSEKEKTNKSTVIFYTILLTFLLILVLLSIIFLFLIINVGHFPI